MCMRTNIVLDDKLVREAMRYADVHTKRALVEQCMRSFIEINAREQRTASYRDRLRRVQEATRSLRFRESAAEIIRRDRDAR